MARNQEKAQSMLFRFREAQLQEMGLLVPRTMRAPSNTQMAASVKECERWRREVFDEISKKITRIQDASLTEHQIRDLNDEINRLLRKKQNWENRIRELGGPDYRRGRARMFDADGKEVPGNRGYKYFGRARELPGVKELLEQAPPYIQRVVTKSDLYKNIDTDYYGYRDEDDGELVRLEREKEAALGVDASQLEPFSADGGDSVLMEDHSVPSQREVEQYLLRRRKEELLEKYSIPNE